MTGQDTLFPNTADGALFDDPRDAEANAMMLAIPKDRSGAPPSPARIFGSLPVTDFNLITIPGLAADLEAVHAAWRDGSLERTPSWIRKMTLRVVGVTALVVLAGIVVWRRRRRQ
jgi:MYXO-CTERM domain-containing protein